MSVETSEVKTGEFTYFITSELLEDRPDYLPMIRADMMRNAVNEIMSMGRTEGQITFAFSEEVFALHPFSGRVESVKTGKLNTLALGPGKLITLTVELK